MKRKVLAITGIRSEYDILYPVIDALRKDRNFEVKVVVCGAHLSDWHGFTVKKIEEDGFQIADKIDYLLMTKRNVQRAKGAGILTQALTQTVEKEKPHFLLVVGDREESIAAAVVGNYMGVLVAHIGGGDTVYGNADDPVRFAVSKLASVHFASSKESAENLLKIGEEKFRVFWVGNPALDNIASTVDVSLAEINKSLGVGVAEKKYIILIKHPLSSTKEESYSQMKITLQSLEKFCRKNSLKTIGIYPNTDPGASDMLRAVMEFNDSECIKFYKTLPRKIFINLMKKTLALAGNSSMGILEAPFYKLPVVNIGNRQKGRLNAGNVEFVGYGKAEIEQALDKACFDKKYRDYIERLENPYGDGKASQKIKSALASIHINDKAWYIKRKLC